jgi:hypothetical protein
MHKWSREPNLKLKRGIMKQVKWIILLCFGAGINASALESLPSGLTHAKACEHASEQAHESSAALALCNPYSCANFCGVIAECKSLTGHSDEGESESQCVSTCSGMDPEQAGSVIRPIVDCLGGTVTSLQCQSCVGG